MIDTSFLVGGVALKKLRLIFYYTTAVKGKKTTKTPERGELFPGIGAIFGVTD